MRGLDPLEYDVLRIIQGLPGSVDREGPNRAESAALWRLLGQRRIVVVPCRCPCGRHIRPCVTAEGLTAMRIHEAVRAGQVTP